MDAFTITEASGISARPVACLQRDPTRAVHLGSPNEDV